VQLHMKVDSTSGSPKSCIELSWNGGTTWTAAKTSSTFTTSEASYILGGAADTWGRTWTQAELANLRVRITNVASNTSRDFSLDWIPVRVTYQSGGGPTPTNTPVPPTATITNTPVPGGNTHSGTWAARGTFAANWNNLYQGVSTTTSSTYVVSIWIKGSGTLRLRAMDNGWSTTLTTVDCAATNTWTQCITPSFNTGSYTSLLFVATDAGGSGNYVYLDDGFIGVSGGANKLVNPGFESGNTNWGVDAAFTILQP